MSISNSLFTLSPWMPFYCNYKVFILICGNDNPFSFMSLFRVYHNDPCSFGESQRSRANKGILRVLCRQTERNILRTEPSSSPRRTCLNSTTQSSRKSYSVQPLNEKWALSISRFITRVASETDRRFERFVDFDFYFGEMCSVGVWYN